MKYFKQLSCVAVVLCAGCSSSHDSQPAAASPPPGGNTADFSNFVVAQYLAPALNDTAPPAEVETSNFTFADDDNPNAFDSVIATAP